MGRERLEVARLLLTELVSNAVRHSDEAVIVSLRLVGDRLRVDVEDTSDRMPLLRQPEDAEAEGRGLRLVDALAVEWGVELVERGKAVWFELCLDAHPEQDDGGSSSYDDDPPSS
jgi:anti-sigma regulatory factor (Ser/Thr protein kinase)